MRTTPSSTFPIGQDYNTEHWSPRILSVRPTCVVLPQLVGSQTIQIWGSPTGSQPEAENALNARFSQHFRHHCSSHNPDQTPRCHSRSVAFFRLTKSVQLSRNPVSITFVLFATFGQFWVKTQPISSLALLFLPGWTMQMHVCSASLSRIYLTYREFKTLLLVSYDI